jgi:hypothetical protein
VGGLRVGPALLSRTLPPPIALQAGESALAPLPPPPDTLAPFLLARPEDSLFATIFGGDDEEDA